MSILFVFLNILPDFAGHQGLGRHSCEIYAFTEHPCVLRFGSWAVSTHDTPSHGIQIPSLLNKEVTFNVLFFLFNPLFSPYFTSDPIIQSLSILFCISRALEFQKYAW